MVLINRLGDTLQVSAPLLGCQLFTIDLSTRTARIRDILRYGEYQSYWQVIRGRAAEAATLASAESAPGAQADLARAIAAEVPDGGRLRDAFRQAGVVEPENISEIRALFRQAKTSNPARGGDIYYFAFDNNALRNRLYSNYLRPQLSRDPHFNFVLAKQVRNELDCRDGKILGTFQKAFEALSPSFSAGAVFSNQNRLQDRLRLLALGELNQLLASGDSASVTTGDEKAGAPPDSDRIIIAAYENFANQPGRKVVLFSSDNEFVMQSSGRSNLIPQLVRYPSEMSDHYQTRWEIVCRLLYQLAILYGRLDLLLPSGDRVLLYGLWQTKTADDFESERLRVTMNTGTSPRLAEIAAAVTRDVEILAEAIRTA